MKSEVYDFYINTNQAWEDPNCLYEAARIIKKETDEIVVTVYYCKTAYQRFGYHLSAQRLRENEIVIIFDDLYANLLYAKTQIFETMIMHELGHIVNGDLDSCMDSDIITQERLREILKGKVQSNELAADRFAVEHCGKNMVLRTLDTITATRKSRNTLDGEIALKELELRKQAVKRL